ncbi:hypothetical protein ABF162_07455 [Vibrio coralliilyticus]|uniref:hypothetical protein n=1 Tax=Vibrio coralliilyticus TaxID=190893 RepID=UPI00052B052F|nr:hypothetical protein [Vibrio coralliilyticus]AIU66862.1 hypothetical protein JV59_31445 [Vibrio coralliilyticus]
MRYANKQKTAVFVQYPAQGQQWTVPRGHRFWAEWGIDKAEQEGRISEPETIAIDDSDSSGSADAV